MEAKLLAGLIDEFNMLLNKAETHIANNEYIYTRIFESWKESYNKIVLKANKGHNLFLQPFELDQWDYSSTRKTIRQTAVDNFVSQIRQQMSKIKKEIEEIRKAETDKEIPAHQMRKCFKLNVESCPVDPPLETNKAFIGMPFRDEYLDSFNYGIKPALDSVGFSFFKADEKISNNDIMCKVCRELQSCSVAIFNISGLNPNVMLELGLAYGIGKPVVILKDKNTDAITDLGSIEYVEYDHAHDLMQKLTKGLPALLKT